MNLRPLNEGKSENRHELDDVNSTNTLNKAQIGISIETREDLKGAGGDLIQILNLLIYFILTSDN